MRNVRTLGLCLIATLAVAAVAATSASALPEWGRCEVSPTHEGKYTDSNCTKKAKKVNLKFTGEFEFKKGIELKPVKFSGGNVGSGGVLTSVFRACVNEREEALGRKTRAVCAAEGLREVNLKGGEAIKIECESEHNTGEAVGSNKVQNVSVKFLGCKAFGSVVCSNGPIEGEIQVNPLKGQLGYISKSEKKVGILLEPAKKKGEFAKFNCGGILGTAVGVGNSKEGAFYEPETTGGYDGIISPITPVNTTTSEYTQVYTVNAETAANIPSKFEGKHIELLEDYLFIPSEPQRASDWSPSGEEVTNVNIAEEPGEIKA